jgi:hypothetical protein
MTHPSVTKAGCKPASIYKLQRPIFIQDVNNKQTVQKIANNLAIG